MTSGKNSIQKWFCLLRSCLFRRVRTSTFTKAWSDQGLIYSISDQRQGPRIYPIKISNENWYLIGIYECFFMLIRELRFVENVNRTYVIECHWYDKIYPLWNENRWFFWLWISVFLFRLQGGLWIWENDEFLIASYEFSNCFSCRGILFIVKALN